MICPKCAYEQADGMSECRRCGVIFAKVRGDDGARAGRLEVQEHEAPVSLSSPEGALEWLKERVLTIPPGENGVMVAGRGAFYLVLLIWGGRLMTSSIQSNYVGESFLHLIARISFTVGTILMLLSLAWGGFILWRQFKEGHRGTRLEI
jgi:hypothetical protein